MIFLEIVMILIGLGAVGYSVSLSASKSEEGTTDKKAALAPITELEEKKEQLQEMAEGFYQKAETLFEETDGKLSHLSNEKIMSISEYADQVMEKIQKNHEDVVFLYDMINEKQDELKALVHEVDVQKADSMNASAARFQQMDEKQKQLDALKKEVELDLLEVQEKLNEVKEYTQTPTSASTNAMYDAEIARIEAEEEQSRLEEEQQQDDDVPLAEEIPWEAAVTPDSEDNGNHNEKIIALYKKGRSVLEISKMLSLGQGEVKFVIDLYKSGLE